MRKTYFAEIDISLNEDEKEKMKIFSNRDIYQETPNRVMHRRVDKQELERFIKFLPLRKIAHL